MKALITILKVWRTHLGRLLLGLLIAELALCSSLFLMEQTGYRLVEPVIGGTIGYALLRIVGSSRIILRYLERLMTHDAMFRVLTDVRVWFYRCLSQGSAAGLGFKRSGDLLSRLVSDVQSLDSVYLRILIPFLTAFITLPIVIWEICRFENYILFIIPLLFFIISFVLPVITAFIAYKAGPNIQKAQASLHVHALDIATGLRETHLFGAEDRMRLILQKKQDRLYSLQKKQEHSLIILHALAVIMSRLGIIIFLSVCVGVFKPSFSHTLMSVSILFIIMTAFDYIVDLPQAGFLAGQTCHAAERIVSVAQSSTFLLQNSSTKKASLPRQFDIECKQVSFGWNKRSFALNNISLHLRSGERTALIGSSGSGKSTLAALLLKVISPQKGHITMGGIDLSNIDNTELREKVAWLSQTSHLFDDTIRQNLLLGRKNFSEKQLWQALERAQIADFVRTLPDGMDSWIGESGSRISGGQGRRIALARILLSSASILILDEPTAGLDIDTERAFLETLNTLDRERTIVLITHRLLGIEHLDHVWRCENGRIFAQPV